MVIPSSHLPAGTEDEHKISIALITASLQTDSNLWPKEYEAEVLPIQHRYLLPTFKEIFSYTTDTWTDFITHVRNHVKKSEKDACIHNILIILLQTNQIWAKCF